MNTDILDKIDKLISEKKIEEACLELKKDKTLALTEGDST